MDEKMKKYPNLEALSEGRISNKLDQWPQLREEASGVLIHITLLEKEWQRLQEVFQVLNEAHSKAEGKIKELKISMVQHFQEEHLGGDGPEIDRWKVKVKKLTEGIEEVLDGTLPYLTEQRLKNLLDDKEGK